MCALVEHDQRLYTWVWGVYEGSSHTLYSPLTPSWSLVTPLVGREGRKGRETIEKAEEGPKCPQEAIDSLHGVARRDQACTESKVPRSLNHRAQQEGWGTVENPG